MYFFLMPLASKVSETKNILRYTYLFDDIDRHINELTSIPLSALTVTHFTDKALALCDKFVPESNFFGYHYVKGKDSVYAFEKQSLIDDLSQYLIFSACMTLKYMISSNNAALSAHELFTMNFNPLNKDDDRRNFSNFSKRIQSFCNSPVSSLLGVRRIYVGDKGRPEYNIPNFHPHLYYAIINNWNTCPLNQDSQSGKNVKSFYGFIKKLKSCCINSVDFYILERLFGFSLLIKLIKSISSNSIDFRYDRTIVLKCFSLLSLLPNTVGRLQYVDFFLKSKAFNSMEKNNSYYESLHENNILATYSSSKPDQLQKEALWLRRCEEFILHMYTFCIPVLENIFLVLLAGYFADPMKSLEFLTSQEGYAPTYHGYSFDDISVSDLTEYEQEIFNLLYPMVFKYFSSTDNVDMLLQARGLIPKCQPETQTELRKILKKVKVESAGKILIDYR